MNYTITSLVQVPDNIVERNSHLDEQYAANNEFIQQELHGTKFQLSVELVIDETPLYLSFLCGSTTGTQLEHCQENYAAIEANPAFLLTDILETIAYDFPALINRNFYSEPAKLAQQYLLTKPLAEQPIITTHHHAVQLHFRESDVILNLTKRDIEYFSELAE